MALARILVDGYSLLHNWPELAAGAPRHSERARDALVEMLQQYQDAGGPPVTVFFDGAGARRKPRAAHRFLDHGEVLVVTDDRAERNVVGGFGGSVASCDNFIRMIGGALADLRDELKTRNRAERNRFNRPR